MDANGTPKTVWGLIATVAIASATLASCVAPPPTEAELTRFLKSTTESRMRFSMGSFSACQQFMRSLDTSGVAPLYVVDNSMWREEQFPMAEGGNLTVVCFKRGGTMVLERSFE